MSDLFAQSRRKLLQKVEPLAVRMRPRTLDEFTGQQHFIAPGKLLRRMLEADRFMSLLFYGPPGTGKTTLASLCAAYTQSEFEQMNAANAGVKEVRAVLEKSRERLENGGKRTVLFIDEIHRFSRSQQDILLGDVEAGIVRLIGATTENPFFAVNSALVSRSQIFQFTVLSVDEIKGLVQRAIADHERGFGQRQITIADDAMEFIAITSDGDARRALTALEIAVLSQPQEAAVHVTLEVAQESMQRKAVVYDPTGDEHYDAASALIKSMRGSDPDAAIYWLARMLEAGEDPRFIARRVAIFASEDVGLADSRAMLVAQAAFDLVERIGMPEAQLTLSHAVLYMATAPKSNSATVAISSAMKDVKEGRTIPVPKHLRDAHYQGAQRLEHGTGYQNPHNHPNGFVQQEYLGVEKTYYNAVRRGEEVRIIDRLEQLKSAADASPELNSNEHPPAQSGPHRPDASE
jgi:putative ATPase